MIKNAPFRAWIGEFVEDLYCSMRAQLSTVKQAQATVEQEKTTTPTQQQPKDVVVDMLIHRAPGGGFSF